MSRPKPTILIEKVDKNYKTDQVLASEGIWAVFYQQQPINLKSFNALVSFASPKYKKVSFSNPGRAINLAKKMNIDLDDRVGNSALHHACITNKFEVGKYLLEKGADPKKKNSHYEIPKDYCTRKDELY